MSYPRKYTGHRISSECLIPGSIPDTGLAVNVLYQEVYRTQDQQGMSYPRKYIGHRISNECLIPGSIQDTGSHSRSKNEWRIQLHLHAKTLYMKVFPK